MQEATFNMHHRHAVSRNVLQFLIKLKVAKEQSRASKVVVIHAALAVVSKLAVADYFLTTKH